MERSVRSNIKTSENSQSCTKLKPEEHIIAYIENREILKDFPPLACDGELLEKVMSNHVILKKILANLSWQEQILSKSVCRTWRDAVLSLRREQFGPCDFVCAQVSHTNQIVFVKSHNFSVEPLAVFVFVEDSFRSKYNCKNISPSPCSPNCTHSHSLLDVIYHSLCFPKKCSLFIKCCYPAHMAKSQSETFKYAGEEVPLPLLAGLYLPKIPNVQFHSLNFKRTMEDLQDFYNEVSRISETRYFKAVIVFVPLDFSQSEMNEILNYFKKIQKDVPYALGGCFIENDYINLPLLIDAIDEGREFDNENEVCIAIFSIAKDMVEDITMKTCFEAYSLVINDFSDVGMQRTVNEFAEKVPRFEYSMALKLTDLHRKVHRKAEQDAFRAAFPDTPISGCYGLGGMSFFRRRSGFEPPGLGSEFLLSYYCTIFMYFGWGKMVGK